MPLLHYCDVQFSHQLEKIAGTKKPLFTKFVTGGKVINIDEIEKLSIDIIADKRHSFFLVQHVLTVCR